MLAKDRPLLSGHVLTDEGILIETRTFRAPERCGAVVQGDFNGDGKREFTLLSAGGSRLHSYLRHPAGWLSSRLPSGTRAAKLLAADLNADGYGDVLCYGRSMAGGMLYFGSPNGIKDSAAVILADISIADAVASDVNGDGVPDLLIADWLGNAVTLFMGLDGLTFTESLKVDVPGEPLDVDIADASPGNPTVLAVLLGDGRTVRTYSVHSAGDVSLSEEVGLDEKARDLRLVDIDGDRRPELMVATPSGLLLSELSPAQKLGRWIAYGVLPEAGAFAVRDVDGDRRRDLVAVEGPRRRLVVCANNSSGGATAWPQNFVTPGEPVAAVLSDVNLDGNPDLVVACRRPPVLALLGNDGRGSFAVEQTVGIPEKPTTLTAVPGSRPGGPTFVTSHAQTNSLGVVLLDERVLPASVRTISTGDRPRVLAAVRDSASALQILVLTRAPAGGGQALSWFDELPTGQFVERASGMPPSVKIVQAVADGNAEPSPTIAALVRGQGKDGLYAWSGRTFPPEFAPFEGVPSASTKLIACGLSKGRDLTVFYVPDHAGTGIAMATLVASTTMWSRPVMSGAAAPAIPGSSIAYDLTGDGWTDLVYMNRRSGAVALLTGGVDGTPAAPRDLVPASGAHVAAVGAPDSNGDRDLYMLRAGVSSVSIIRGGMRP